MRKGLLLVLSGPSGVGQGTIGAELLRNHSDMCFSVSATTRAMREGEAEGVNYFYKSTEEFERMVEQDEFLEYMCVFGKNYYGTPRKYVDSKLNEGISVLLDIDVKGAMKVKEKMPEAVTVFIAPPSLAVLKNRLVGRGTESEEAIARRLAECKTEIGYIPRYDYVIINDALDKAVADIEAILTSVSLKSANNTELADRLINEEF